MRATTLCSSRPTSSRIRGPWLQALALAALLVGLFGCAGVQVRTQEVEGVDLAEYVTFAHDEPTPAGDGEEALLERRIRSAIERELASRNMRLSPQGGADLLVEHQTRIAVRSREMDPFFDSLYRSKQTEQGSLEVTLVDAASGDVVWSGSGECELRTVSRSHGLYERQSSESDEERDWPIEDLVARILARLPEK